MLHLNLEQLPLPVPQPQLLLQGGLYRIHRRLLRAGFLRRYRAEGGPEHLLLDPVVMPDREAEFLGRLGGGQQPHLDFHHQLDSPPVLG